MNEAQEITRILFEDFSTTSIYLFYIVGYTAIAVFLYGCYVQVRKYRRGKPDAAWGEIFPRFIDMVKTMLTHRTIKRRDTAAGKAHAGIFFGFVLLFIGTATITLEYDILEPLFGFKFWYGDFYLWFSLILDVAGVAVIAGLIYMMYRRKWLKLPKLDYTRPDREPGDPDYDRSFYRREDWAFLWSFILIVITGFLLESSRLVWLMDDATVWDYRWWSPVGAAIAGMMHGLGMGPEAAGTFRTGLWWFHGVLALTFIAVIPFTKIKHIFTASASLMFRDPKAGIRLPTVPEEQEDIGVKTITDFTWKQLLHLDACTKCGRCHEACPANAVGAPLSPRDVILSLREFANNALEKKELPDEVELDVHGKDVGQVFMETLWSCRTCMACVEICPVAIEHVPIIVQMRRKLVDEGNMDPILQKTLQSVHKTGNSMGESKRKRAKWTKDLSFEIKDARKEPVDVMWFVGDYASFDPRNQVVTKSFARIMKQAGVDFGLLYEAEMNAGNDVRRVGEEGLYELLASSNINTLDACEFNSIVTTDPHSFNTIRNEYPDFGGEFEIQHYTTLLKQLLDEGKLKLKKKLDYCVTFHDPCHLGRYNKGYDAPREVIKMLGCDLVEMDRNRDNSFCCGAGGGRIWIPDPVGIEKPSENRMKEAAEIEGLQVFIVSCPKDLTMFEDALKTSGNEGKFVVKELIELVNECIEFDDEEDEGADLATA
ncbi:heterodisulfide reductase-related iron-sulfur binding cluster [Methylophaga sp. OBS4]|uniref:heterodisulfide reductase-related iron-sulfur binding cluster n=1 Tax=Methylophaga sp. OBS4 TaxID=2991935 RepID=UPI00224CEE89|nr:heterodisulfide reductase-related iron-sulfur binding cluster [Methylophaga sp. OBS4]MCX4187079.1 heterodisulfide reductase-related iron-sulfur binding cluster [Methylophaga sp. OBS4]